MDIWQIGSVVLFFSWVVYVFFIARKTNKKYRALLAKNLDSAEFRKEKRKLMWGHLGSVFMGLFVFLILIILFVFVNGLMGGWK